LIIGERGCNNSLSTKNINIFAEEEEEGNIAYRWCISGGSSTAGIFPVNKQFYTYL